MRGRSWRARPDLPAVIRKGTTLLVLLGLIRNPYRVAIRKLTARDYYYYYYYYCYYMLLLLLLLLLLRYYLG